MLQHTKKGTSNKRNYYFWSKLAQMTSKYPNFYLYQSLHDQCWFMQTEDEYYLCTCGWNSICVVTVFRFYLFFYVNQIKHTLAQFPIFLETRKKDDDTWNFIVSLLWFVEKFSFFLVSVLNPIQGEVVLWSFVSVYMGVIID